MVQLFARLAGVRAAHLPWSGHASFSVMARTTYPRCSRPGPAVAPHRIRVRWRHHASGAYPQMQRSTDLVDLFDRAPASQTTQTGLEPVGLLFHPLLTSQQGFVTASQRTLQRAQHLVLKIVEAETSAELRMVVKIMDQLSDELCSIMDIAEFVRMAHPNEGYRQVAQQAFGYLFEYMNTLNTHTQLYQKLKQALTTPEISRDFSPLERHVAELFLRDFEKSGIHLPDGQRAEFVHLSNTILDLGHHFMAPEAPPASRSRPQYVTVPSADHLAGLPDSFLRSLGATSPSDSLRLPVPSSMGNVLIGQAKRETVRRDAFRIQRRVAADRVAVLDQLLWARQALAKLTGRPTYAHMFLEDKMAQSPDNVRQFLLNLGQTIKPQTVAELQALEKIKTQQSHPNLTPSLQAWDKDFCLGHARPTTPTSLPSLYGYFTVGGAIQGLSTLFNRLYGITLQPGRIAPGEVWHTHIQKLEVMDEAGVQLGTIYCDLFSRPNKAFQGAAHFTVRCSRRIDDDVPVGHVGPARMPEQIRTDRATGQSFQRPMVVLVCNFTPAQRGSPSILGFPELETLFHEMGHAMHSMLALTSFHNVAGTRCPVDFVELPSILMEQFAHDHRVLSLFARHYQTGQPLHPELLADHLRQRRAFSGLETASQVLMSVMDQCYHGAIGSPAQPRLADALAYLEPAARARMAPTLPSTPSAGQLSSPILHLLQDSGLPLSFVPYVDGVDWQVTIGHLVGYGGGYYAYLFDRVLAARIWERKFAQNPLSRAAGEAYRQKLLCWGGGRDPWHCIGDLLEDPIVSAGNEEAMREVGRWGLSGF
ncbi:Mitochondrial intermediate peptidase [Dimargaris cristalligena]|nr:Mitochondrial intermediate peptidase [Dimargaris cristalligena]